MARNLSDIFSSDDNEQDTTSRSSADQNADSGADASNDGLSISNQSFSRDDDGEVQQDRTDIDSGNSDLGSDLDVDSMIDNLTNSSSSSSDTEILDL